MTFYIALSNLAITLIEVKSAYWIGYTKLDNKNEGL